MTRVNKFVNYSVIDTHPVASSNICTGLYRTLVLVQWTSVKSSLRPNSHKCVFDLTVSCSLHKKVEICLLFNREYGQ